MNEFKNPPLTHTFSGMPEDNNENFKKQLELIKKSKKKKEKVKMTRMTEEEQRIRDMTIYNRQLEKSNKTNEYDPLDEFYTEGGLTGQNLRIVYDVNYVNIDSSLRDINPSVETETLCNLSTDPFSISKSSKTLIVTHENHGYAVDDKIILYGLEYDTNIVNAYTTSSVLEFTSGSQYLTINYAHGIDLTVASSYDISDLVVEFSGIVGMNGTTYIGNVSINSLNVPHQLLLTTDTITTIVANKFYILLPVVFSGSYTTSSYNFSIIFRYYAGIPTNIINADIPTTNENIIGYQCITAITTNTYSIELQKLSGATLTFGGNTIKDGKIKSIETGYPDPNHYIMHLDNTLYNIANVEIVSSEFPNSGKIINISNYKFYWQNYDDGDYVYSVSLDTGNYTPNTFKTAIEKKIYDTTRINYLKDKESGTSVSYTNHNYITFDIIQDTGLVEIKSYKISQLSQPLVSVSPDIPINASNDSGTLVSNYTLTIKHSYHGLSVGQKITISGVYQYMGIPTNAINKEHTISEIVDENNYKIILDPFNLSAIRSNNGGGNAITIVSPLKFRVRFDYTDTCGAILGFRKTGQTGSITDYSISCRNNQTYPYEESINLLGDTITITHDPLGFSGDNYIIINCIQLDNIKQANGSLSIFAKILLNGDVNYILFDSYVNTPMFLYDPIAEISELEFYFYKPNGTTLYDFDGYNHSFLLKITTIHKIPDRTGINTLTGIAT
jgi:hypothetical protein